MGGERWAVGGGEWWAVSGGCGRHAWEARMGGTHGRHAKEACVEGHVWEAHMGGTRGRHMWEAGVGGHVWEACLRVRVRVGGTHGRPHMGGICEACVSGSVGL